MKNFLKYALFIIITTLPVIILFLYIDLQKTQKDEGITTQEEENSADKEIVLIDQQELLTQREEIDPICSTCETTIEKADTLKQTAWIPAWDYNNGIESLKGFETNFYSISPVTYQINNDGSLTPRLDSNLIELRKTTEEKNIKLIPTISNFDSEIMSIIFNSVDNTQRHIDSILQAVEIYNYDGIDLDYESIKLENKEHFLNFVMRLAQELEKKNKTLSITVLPKWGDDVMYTSLTETRKVQDWERIAKYAHEIRIMAYDFTSASSSKEGPIAPIDWLENILKYAKEKIPSEKIWLGIHLYSYEWVLPTKDSEEIKTRTNSYTYDTVKSKILNHSYVESRYNTQYQEGYAEYKCLENYHCIIYYATPESVKVRQDLAKKHNIAGVAYWRLGGEEDLIR